MSENEIIGPYQIGRTIGAGIFAKVKLGEDEFRQKVAVKIFDKALLARSSHQVQQVEKELNSLRCCYHPHIVQFYEVLETDTQIFLVMEHLNGGELYDYILDQGRLSEEEGGRLFGQILSAVHHCHQRGIVHRDLKPENILLTHQKSSDGVVRPVCKLVDFGLANYFDTNVDSSTRSLQTQCGSPHYASPEILTGQKYSGPLSDVWSLGVLLYAMLCGSLPFNARSVPLLIKKIVEGKFKFPKFLSPSSRHLISSILQIQCEQRPSLEDIMRHPWIVQYAHLDSIKVSSSNAYTANHDEASPSSTSSSSPPPFFRPLSRPEIINPENPRPQPGDFERLMSKHNQSHRRSLKSDNAALPHSDILTFPGEDQLRQTAAAPSNLSIPPPVPISSGSFLADLLSPRKRKPVQCQFCSKMLTARTSESGDFTLSSDGIMGSKYELCTCLRARSQSPVRSQSPLRAASITSNPQLSSQDTPSSKVTSGSASPSTPSHSLSTVASPMNSVRAMPGDSASSDAGGFQTHSLRENYFHPDDPRRKNKRDANFDTEQDAADTARRQQEELLRAKNEELFLRACEHGDVETVVALIEPPVDENGFTVGAPLVDVRAKAIDNWTGLHYAARAGQLDVVQSLLSSLQPIDINCRTKSSWSALMCAADKGHADVCALLIKYGAAIHITNSDGKSAIFLARESGFHEIAQMLTNASSTRHKRHALLSSTNTTQPDDSNNHDSLDKQSNRQSIGNTSNERELNYELFRAAEFGDVSKVRHLLELNTNKQEHHVSRRAQTNDGPNTTTGQPADASQSPSISSPPLRYSVDVTARGIDHWTALHFAARKGRTSVVEILLNHQPPAPVNAVTKNGWTPLMMACDKGFTDIVRLLIQHGADCAMVSLDGSSAATVARESQHRECLELIQTQLGTSSA